MAEFDDRAMTGPAICFLETGQEVDAFITHCRASDVDPRSITVVALTFEIQVMLRRLDIPFETTLELFGRKCHEDVLVAAEELVRRIGRQVDLRLDSQVIRETYHDTFHFKIQYYINHFLFVLHVIEAAVERFRPSEVLLPDGPGPLSPNPDQLILANERWASRILALFCESHGLRTTRVTVTNDSESAAEDEGRRSSTSWALNLFADSLVSYVRRSACVLYSGSFDGFRTLSSQLRGLDRRLILLDDTPLSWLRTAANWIRALSGRGVVLSTDGRPGETPGWLADHEKAFAERIAVFQDTFENVEHKGVLFSRVYKEKVILHLLPSIYAMASRINRHLTLVSSLPVSHVVVISAREMALAFCEYAKWRGIPSVMVSHGTAIAPKNRLEEIENSSIGSSLQLSPLVSAGAIQSPLEEDHVKHFAPTGTMLRTGPVLFGDRDTKGTLKARPARDHDDEVTILMASSCKNRATYRFWAMETPDEFLESCRDMIAAVNATPGVRLVIRLHKKLVLPTADFLSLLPESDRVTIDREGIFKRALRSCDLVVSFASTTIEESLQNGVPVLLYDPWGRYQHCDAAHVQNPDDLAPAAVHYVNRRRHLTETLWAIVERQLRGPQDRSLFSRYCYGSGETIGFADMLDVLTEGSDSEAIVRVGEGGGSCRSHRKTLPECVDDESQKLLGHSSLQGRAPTPAIAEGGTGIALHKADPRGRTQQLPGR